MPSNGLIGCFSGDEKLIFATAWEPYQELFQGVARCLHSDFRIGGLAPGETKKIRGKIYLARNKRQPIPEGWAITADGAPTTDPQAAIDGIILPMAGHKGYAIAAMVDMMSGVLTGSGFLSAVHSPYKTAEKSNCGHFMMAINIEAMQPLAAFNARMEQFVAEIKSVPLAQGCDEVFYPGEMEARNDARNRKQGIDFPDDTIADLKRIAGETGLQALLPVD